MSTRIRCIGVALSLVMLACGGSDGDDEGAGDTSSGGPSSTTASTTASESGTSPTTTMSAETGTGGESEGSDDTSTSEDSGGTSESGTSEGSSDSGGAVVWDEEFVWVADFLRTNCVSCHSAGRNGNLLLPAPDITNDEVRLALEGVVATTGLLMVEPGDRNTSQTWLQITNEFGAQFPVEDTDRFGAWIDAGAHYLAE